MRGSTTAPACGCHRMKSTGWRPPALLAPSASGCRKGDDHISNTPKHVLLFGAFESATPQFAHVPLILGEDKKRLSKRHGATSVMEYKRLGYLPDAMVNFLALLGWSPGDDRELMTRAELIEAFSLRGISGGNAVFNAEKLDWMNGQYIARPAVDELAAEVEPLLREAGVWPESPAPEHRAWLMRVLELLRPRARRLSDFVEQARPFLVDTVEYEPEAVEKHLGTPHLHAHVEALVKALRTTHPFDESHVEAAVRGTASERGLKAGSLIHATRLAVTGRASSPGLFEVLSLLGRDRTLQRLEQLLAYLDHRTQAIPPLNN
jgi:glutamyl-tRNA synthetase